MSQEHQFGEKSSQGDQDLKHRESSNLDSLNLQNDFALIMNKLLHLEQKFEKQFEKLLDLEQKSTKNHKLLVKLATTVLEELQGGEQNLSTETKIENMLKENLLSNKKNQETVEQGKTESLEKSVATPNNIATPLKAEKPSSVSELSKVESTSEQTPLSRPLTLEDKELVDFYNKEPRNFEKVYSRINVSLTQNSYQQNNYFDSKQLFQKDNRGTFWLVNIQNEKYLLPENNFRINPFIYKALNNIFDCHGYSEDKAYDLTLIKPARVKLSCQKDTWEVVDKGVIEFTCK